MKISKQDALTWFRFFAMLPEGEELQTRQQEIALSVFYQIERRVEENRRHMMADIPGLRSLGGRTLYVGPEEKFPRGCKSCLFGTGLSAIRKTNRCNVQCPFCYNYGELDCQEPIGEGLWEIGGSKYAVEDIPLLLSIQKKPTGVAYVYLEPFMEIEKYGPVIRVFREAGVYQHLYTNGTLCTEENLRALGESGLDEIRFNLGASGCSPKVVAAMATAKKYIPAVGVETPMTPAFSDWLDRHADALLATGLDFINCAELHLNPNNLPNYEGENLYMSRQGYISPVFSRDLTLRLMARADREKWPVAVHDCSNRTKFARELNLKAKEGGWFGQNGYGCEFPTPPYAAFLPILEDPSFAFVEEEPLPDGYRPGQIVL